MTKQNTIDITTLTSKQLRDNRYIDEFPEYYALRTVSENNAWHDHQNVLDHVILVFEGLEHVLLFKDFDSTGKVYFETYLTNTIGNISRKNILKVATLLHDIAKSDTLLRDKDETTRCPGHELIASGRVNEFAERFNLNRQSCGYVERIVRYHGFISDILNVILSNGNKEKYLNIFRKTVGDVDIELLLLMHADLLGCDLKKLDKKAFDDRINILSWMLDERISS